MHGATIKITRKCYSIQTVREITAFRAPISTKVSSAQQRDVQISSTEFQLNWTINAEKNDRNLFRPLSKIRFSLFWFSRKIHSLNKILWVSLVPLFFELDENVEYVERFSFTSFKCMPLTAPCNSKFPDGIRWRYFVQNIVHRSKKMGGGGRERNSLTSSSKVRPSLNQF